MGEWVSGWSVRECEGVWECEGECEGVWGV